MKIKDRIKELRRVKASELVPNPKNWRTHPTKQKDALKGVLSEIGYADALLARELPDGSLMLLDGHLRAETTPEQEVPVLVLDLTEEEGDKLLATLDPLASLAEQDDEKLAELLEGISTDNEALQEMLDELAGEEIELEESEETGGGILAEKYIEPPFSVLDSKKAEWQKRKKAWKRLIQSEKGRGENLLKFSDSCIPYTSIFDPVLCEILIQWFSPKTGRVIDPFAGGSVRGVISSFFGRQYVGLDIREEQIEENKNQWDKLKGEEIFASKPAPKWICEDSQNIDRISDSGFDFLLTCPPYHDLEKYGDKANDLSNMDYEAFKVAYSDILQKTVSKLKENAFCAIVVGEIRDKKGFYKNFVPFTIEAMGNAGARFYNEIILLNPVGSSAIRVNGQFPVSRKVVKTHQNVLIFVKGDVKKINLEPVEVVDISEYFTDEEIEE